MIQGDYEFLKHNDRRGLFHGSAFCHYANTAFDDVHIRHNEQYEEKLLKFAFLFNTVSVNGEHHACINVNFIYHDGTSQLRLEEQFNEEGGEGWDAEEASTSRRRPLVHSR